MLFKQLEILKMKALLITIHNNCDFLDNNDSGTIEIILIK